MADKDPDRAERRRQEKEAAKQKVTTCTECKEGPCDIEPKTYDKCPVCGCPSSFTVAAMKGDIHLQDFPALFSFEKIYDTPNAKIIKLVAVGASCARCGVFYTLARDKVRSVPLVVPKRPGDGGPRIILPGQAG